MQKPRAGTLQQTTNQKDKYQMNHERAMIKQEPPMLSPALEHLAESISRSTIIPKEFAGSPANCLIALEMAHRVGAGVLQVMQSLYIVHGKPSWSGQFVIAAVNSTKRFSALRFEFNHDKTECVAVADDLDGNELRGPTVSIEMAKKEGWWARNPKWQNLTELMLMYRSGTFFGRVYCPDILMGMREQYEILEAEAVEIREPKISTVTKDIITDVAGGGSNEQQTAAPAQTHFTKQGHPLPVEKPEPQKRAPKKKLQVKTPPPQKEAPLIETGKIGPYRKALAERLAVGNYTEDSFLGLANRHEWLGKGKVWQSMDDVPDGMFEVFLSEEEWPTVEEQLEKTRTVI
jgi:hypothetical protein